ncbi:MAG: hypothetical protein JXX14_00860 [Deltaproteobacteria bacterium]|nr:hypothetical protein [Deltaproteobacteria bacterium]
MDARNTEFAFLKHMTAPVGAFRRALLWETHLFGQKEIRGCDFSEAILVAMNLGGKKVLDCNFTGAVFKAVHTDGWVVDEATKLATKFIYTDMRVATEADWERIAGEWEDEHADVSTSPQQVEENVTPAKAS